jgi:hypothetical protein
MNKFKIWSTETVDFILSFKNISQHYIYIKIVYGPLPSMFKGNDHGFCIQIMKTDYPTRKDIILYSSSYKDKLKDCQFEIGKLINEDYIRSKSK